MSMATFFVFTYNWHRTCKKESVAEADGAFALCPLTVFLWASKGSLGTPFSHLLLC